LTAPLANTVSLPFACVSVPYPQAVVPHDTACAQLLIAQNELQIKQMSKYVADFWYDAEYSYGWSSRCRHLVVLKRRQSQPTRPRSYHFTYTSCSSSSVQNFTAGLYAVCYKRLCKASPTPSSFILFSPHHVPPAYPKWPLSMTQFLHIAYISLFLLLSNTSCINAHNACHAYTVRRLQ